MNFTVVFDVTQAGYRQGSFPAFGLIFLALSGGIILFRRRRAKPVRLQDYLFFGIAVFWTVMALVSTSGDYLRLSSALRDGRCELVEGAVSEFYPMPKEGHQME